MKKILHLFALPFITTGLYAQDPDIQWQKNYGSSGDDYPHTIVPTSDGGFIAAGRAANNSGDVTGSAYLGLDDGWIIKMDASGTIQWKKCYGGTNYEEAKQVVETADGGYTFSGYATNSHGVPGFHGPGAAPDIWLASLDGTGAILWEKFLGGSGQDVGMALLHTSDKGYFVAGQTNSTNGDITGNHGATDAWMAKTDSAGTIQWQKCFGGTDNELAWDAIQLPDSGFVVTGYTYSSDGDITAPLGNADIWVLRLDKNGNEVWKKLFGGTGSESGTKVVMTHDGNYMLTGYTSSTDGDFAGIVNMGLGDVFLMKISPAGNRLLCKKYGSSKVENSTSLYACSDNGFIIGGSSMGSDGDVPNHYGDPLAADVFLVKTDNMGNVEWSKAMGGDNEDKCMTVMQTSDNGYVVGGYSFSSDHDVAFNNGGADFWIFKLGEITNVGDLYAEMTEISVYPNPANGTFQVSGVKAGFAVNVFDSMGQLVFTAVAQGDKQMFTIDLVAGMYICQVVENGKVIGQGKLIVE